MPQRLRLYDMRFSRLPGVVGLCQSDIVGLARYCNSAQQRLLYCKEAGDEGWYGTFAEIVFEVSRDQPYITLPREVARLEMVDAMRRPIPVNNQFYEYLLFGNGRLPKHHSRWCARIRETQGLMRNNVPTFVDLGPGPQFVQIFPGDPIDVANARRVLIQGLDQNGNDIYSQDVLNRVRGVFVTLQSPFAPVPMQMTKITGIQKDQTAGHVQVFQVDPNSGAQVLLSTLQAGEQTAWYRRYYFDELPRDCCYSPNSTPQSPLLQMRAIAKMEPLPVVVDTDYFLIQNKEAMIEECASVRYSEMDTVAAKGMASDRHTEAVRYLNGELTHYYGKNSPAISFTPFGSARLEHVQIGML